MSEERSLPRLPLGTMIAVMLIGWVTPVGVAGTIAVTTWAYLSRGAAVAAGAALALAYVAPPLLARLTLLVFAAPTGRCRAGSRSYLVFWFLTQLQLVYSRFAFLEEALRVVPGLYGWWLRLWGARVGRAVFFGPGLRFADRSSLRIGDFVVFGAFSGMTGHLLTHSADGQTYEVILASPVVEQGAIVGATAYLGPGAVVGAGEVLPATTRLAPFYAWRDGRRRAGDVEARERLLT